MDVDLRIAELAARQHSVFTLAQARQLARVGRWFAAVSRAGDGVSSIRACFRIAGSEPTWEQKLFAAWLAAGEGAVVSHASAGRWWEFPRIPDRLELSVAHDRRPNLHDVTVHRVVALDPVDRLEPRGLTVTSPTRTLIDMAASLPRELINAALEHCLDRRLTTVPYVRRRLEALGTQGRRGTKTLIQLLDARPTHRREPDSAFERRLLRLLSQLDGPPPIPQYVLRAADGKARRLDAAWPDLRLGIEANSYLYHSSLSSWAADNTRTVTLVADGWRILPVTWFDLEERPEWFLEMVQRARAAEVWSEVVV
jgi:hypothetical protein